MPGAIELSTVEWQSAHWMPIERRRPPVPKKPGTRVSGREKGSALRRALRDQNATPEVAIFLAAAAVERKNQESPLIQRL
jgi:hypothetical protein